MANASGHAMIFANAICNAYSFMNSMTLFAALAPNTFRMAISLVRLDNVNVTIPNIPNSTMMNIRTVARLPAFFSCSLVVYND
ncbi:MAG: hypothetical protein KF845_15245 [Cyclobacteriaceae bacterium]|nr:hypothetical protein [Cyclobacteriaceae bacterium]